MDTFDHYDDATLEDAKEWLRKRFAGGARCPCCNQYVQRYKRKLNSSMAYVLILLYHWDQVPPVGDYIQCDAYVHMPSYLAWAARRNPPMAAAIRGDWAKLKHWSLIKEMPNAKRPDGSKRAGYYQMTELGRRFVNGTARVPAYIFLYNEQPLTVADDTPSLITIQDALGVKFSYNELMEGV